MAEMDFFIYLLEPYAEYKGAPADAILKKWDEKDITQEILDGYWGYHTEAIENAFVDIDSLTETGQHAW